MASVIVQTLLKTVIAIGIAFTVSVLFVISLIFSPYNYIVWTVAKVFKPHLTPVGHDGITSYLSTDNLSNPNSASVAFTVIDGAIGIGKLRQNLQHRVIKKRNPDLSLPYERLTKYPIHFWGKPFFKTDLSFRIDNHVRVYDFKEENLQISHHCEETDLQRILGPLIGYGFKPEMSPWELLVAHGFLKDGDSKNTVLIWRMHHVLGDGLSFVYLLENLFQMDYPFNFNRTKGYKKMPLWRKVALTAATPLQACWDFADEMLENRVATPRAWSTDGHPSGEYYAGFTPPIPVELIKSIKNNLGVSYLSVLLGACMISFRKIMIETSKEIPDKLSLHISIPKPNHPKGLHIHAFATLTALALDYEDMGSCIQNIYENVARKTSSKAALMMNILVEMLGAWPTYLISKTLNSYCPNSGLFSPIPVCSQPWYFDGLLVSDSVIAVGPCSVHSGLAVVLFGGNGNQRIAVTIDKKVFPSQKIFMQLLSHIHDAIIEMSSIQPPGGEK